MRHTTATMLAIALAGGAAGCFGLLPQQTQKQKNERELSEQDKREVRAYGGEELLTDMEQLLSTAPKGDPIFSCLSDYMVAMKVEKESAKKGKENDVVIMSHNDRCTRACAESDAGAYATVAAKYGGRCKEKEAVAAKGFYLRRRYS